jgi:hypothetical protein
MYRVAAFGRRVGHVRGTVVSTRQAVERVQGAEALRTFFCKEAAEFLLRGSSGTSPLRSPAVEEGRFQKLRERLPVAAHPVLDELKREIARRRQLDRQASLHFWLHCWLWLHLPLSAALLVLIAAHAFSAWRY